MSNERKKALLLKLNAFEENEKLGLENKKLTSSGSTGSVANSLDSSGSNCSITNIQENGHDHIKELKKPKDKSYNETFSSELQLKSMVSNLTKKSSTEDPIKERLNDYCTEIITQAESCNKKVDRHILDYQKTTKETEALMSALQENDEISKKFSHISVDDKLMVFDYSDYYKLKDKNSNHISKVSDKSSCSSLEELSNTSLTRTSRPSRANSNKSEVDDTDKEKLLAKLRAIDNGESVEITNPKKTKQDLLKELFG